MAVGGNVKGPGRPVREQFKGFWVQNQGVRFDFQSPFLPGDVSGGAKRYRIGRFENDAILRNMEHRNGYHLPRIMPRFSS